MEFYITRKAYVHNEKLYLCKYLQASLRILGDLTRMNDHHTKPVCYLWMISSAEHY